MADLDPQAIRHALLTARRHGFSTVRLEWEGAGFRARLRGDGEATVAETETYHAAVESSLGWDERVAVTAPVVGYIDASSPAPEPGQHVSEEQALLRIIAVGLANEVASPCEGEIDEVHVQPGQPVEYGQPLLHIRRGGGGRHRGSSLVGTLVAVALLLVLVLFFVFRGYGLAGTSQERPDKVGETIVGRSRAAAKDVVCRSNLSQVRQAIQVYMSASGDEEKPPDLGSLRLPSEVLADPIGKEPYVYDPSTATVRCVHPGHERY